MIRVEHLTRKYPGALAVDDVSFQIPAGQIVGFLGLNGAGKTTTLRMLTGALAPTAGRAPLAGHDVARESRAVRRRLGYLPESAPLYPEMRVLDYLRYVAGARRIPRRERRAHVDAAIAACGLGAVLTREIRALSRGFRQRVGLAQAIVHQPDVLILDEPTAGLDPSQIVEIRALIRSIGEQKTVIFSSHILSEVQALCSRVLILHEGRIVADDAPSRLAGRASQRQRLHVAIDGADAETLSARLGDLADVAEAHPDDRGGALVASKTGADARPAVFQAVVDAGWVLLEMRPAADDLERAFLRLTTGVERRR